MSAAIRSNAQIKEIIENNTRILNDVDRWISSDLAKPFQSKMSLTLSANGSSKPRAVYYDEMEKLFRAFKEREDLKAKYDKSKEETKEFMASVKSLHFFSHGFSQKTHTHNQKIIVNDDYAPSDNES